MLPRAVLPALLALALAATTLDARAQEDGADRPPRPSAPQPTRDKLRRITLTTNPLAMIMGRYGANAEVLPARHHAIVVSAYVQSFSMTMVSALVPEYQDRLGDTSVSGAGGELGYRFYSGRTGADGLFVGPSFVVMPLAYPRLDARSLMVELSPFYATGAALDVGAQVVTRWGFTVGGGAGAMLLAYNIPDDPQRLPLTFTPRVLPRLLFTAGWSF
jgi:hypothetical protein